MITSQHIYTYVHTYDMDTYRVLGWNRNRKPGIGPKRVLLGRISHEMPISAVFLLKKGSLCLVCVYIVSKTENPDTQDLP